MQQTSWLEHPQARRVLIALRRPSQSLARLRWRALALAVLCALVAAELAGRMLGLHTPVLYEKTSYGYRPLPNQRIMRFGHRIEYDQNGLRSEPVSALPEAGSRRVLFLGDSIVNGGARIDQASTIPYLVRDAMSSRGRPVEVLNAATPGWAIANEARWFHRHGVMGASQVVLVTNTYDFFQEEADADVVGQHPSFPERGPGLALIEIGLRYLWPRLAHVAEFQDPGADMHEASPVLMGQVLGDLRWIILRARSQSARALVVLVEPVLPLSASARALGEQALGALRAELALLDVPLIDTTDALRRAGGAAVFRDGLHPNAAGNAVIAGVIADTLDRPDGGGE